MVGWHTHTHTLHIQVPVSTCGPANPLRTLDFRKNPCWCLKVVSMLGQDTSMNLELSQLHIVCIYLDLWYFCSNIAICILQISLDLIVLRGISPSHVSQPPVIMEPVIVSVWLWRVYYRANTASLLSSSPSSPVFDYIQIIKSQSSTSSSQWSVINHQTPFLNPLPFSLPICCFQHFPFKDMRSSACQSRDAILRATVAAVSQGAGTRNPKVAT